MTEEEFFIDLEARRNFYYEEVGKVNRITRRFEFAELSIYVFLGTLVASKLIPLFDERTLRQTELRNKGLDVNEVALKLTEYNSSIYNYIWATVAIILAPIIYKLVFRWLPLNHIRIVVSKPYAYLESIKPVAPDKSFSKVETFLAESITAGEKIAERTFSRAGVYMVIGTLIAVVGVFVFYAPYLTNEPTMGQTSGIPEVLVKQLPRFGALFFIEFVAIYFLKQHRIYFEEYRFFESVKRKRQDTRIILELIEKLGEDKDLLRLVVDHVARANGDVLEAGQTTQHLEAKKMVDNDMDILAKFNELVKTLKS